MSLKGISGSALAASAAGGVLLWSGLKGFAFTDVVRDLVAGRSPADERTSHAIGTGLANIGEDIINGTPGGGSQSADANRLLAQKMAAQMYGWTGAQWSALDKLGNRESGWSNTAENPSSGAYGIAQALPPTKYPRAGQKSGGSQPAAQIQWMLSYIRSRYGDPVHAWAHETSQGWY